MRELKIMMRTLFDLVCILPAYCGFSGDVINERSFTLALAKALAPNTLLIFSLIPITKIHFSKKCTNEVLRKVKNLKVIWIPIPFYPALLYFILSSFISLLLSLLLSLIKVKVVYIRGSHLSIGMYHLRSQKKKIIVKIPSVTEDEIIGSAFEHRILKILIDVFDRHALYKADRIVTDTITFYNTLVIRRGILHASKPIILPPGIDSSIMGKIRMNTKPIANGSIRVGFIGTLYWWQGVDILCRAIALARKKKSNIHLLIIGDGPQRPFIERLCKELELPYEITGYLPHEKALSMLKMMDMLVIPSRRTSTRETKIPIKIIEAWALGIPVITTKHKVFQDYNIKDMEEVIYCEPDPYDVANKILMVINDQELMHKLQINGYKISKKFEYEHIAQKFLSELNLV